MKNDLLTNNGPQIDPREYPDVVCDKCGCNTFSSAFVLKKIPGLLLGTGEKEIEYPLSVFICTKCGEILKRDKELLKMVTEEKKESKIIVE